MVYTFTKTHQMAHLISLHFTIQNFTSIKIKTEILWLQSKINGIRIYMRKAYDTYLLLIRNAGLD